MDALLTPSKDVAWDAGLFCSPAVDDDSAGSVVRIGIGSGLVEAR